jgi:hypothetical protein
MFQLELTRIPKAVEHAIDHVLKDATVNVVCVGPVHLSPSKPKLYFMVASWGLHGFRCDQMFVTDPDLRATFVNALAKRRLVIHDCDDELEMAKLCETIWPGPKITALRQAVERERATQ